VYTRYEDQSGKMSSPDLGSESDILTHLILIKSRGRPFLQATCSDVF
jgi:hypothetical protein